MAISVFASLSVSVKEELYDLNAVVYKAGSSLDSVFYLYRGNACLVHDDGLRKKINKKDERRPPGGLNNSTSIRGQNGAHDDEEIPLRENCIWGTHYFEGTGSGNRVFQLEGRE